VGKRMAGMAENGIFGPRIAMHRTARSADPAVTQAAVGMVQSTAGRYTASAVLSIVARSSACLGSTEHAAEFCKVDPLRR